MTAPAFLGISANGTSSAACLVRGGEVAAAVEEERFTRVKNDGAFPRNAIRWCLQAGGVAPEGLAGVAVSWDYDKFVPAGGEAAAMRRFTRRQDAEGLRMNASAVEDYLARFDRAAVLHAAAECLPGAPDPAFLGHHDCHAASAFDCSGFGDALVLVLDGSGEEFATSVYEARDGRLEAVERVEVPHSLGHFFQAVTEFAGYRPTRDEGTVMALAALGGRPEPLRALMRDCLRVGGGTYRVDPDLVSKSVFDRPRERFGGRTFTDVFAERLVRAGVRPGMGPAQNGRVDAGTADLAAVAQDALTEAVLEVAGHHLRRSGLRRLCLAGGVALNCRANGAVLRRLAEEGVLRGMFVQPASHDAGGALGAALLAARAAGYPPPRHRMRSAALGPSFAPAELEAALRAAGVPFAPLRGRWDALAQRLHGGDIAAMFSGRAEFGPRALGQRSILASPRSAEITARLNEIKRRQSFRPLCPSMMAHPALPVPYRSVYSPDFMVVAYDGPGRPPPGTVGAFHHDGSFRPQLLPRGSRSGLGRVLRAMERVSGLPLVLNTSFNVGTPVVGTPAEAVETFLGADIDLLVMDGWVAWKDRPL